MSVTLTNYCLQSIRWTKYFPRILSFSLNRTYWLNIKQYFMDWKFFLIPKHLIISEPFCLSCLLWSNYFHLVILSSWGHILHIVSISFVLYSSMPNWTNRVHFVCHVHVSSKLNLDWLSEWYLYTTTLLLLQVFYSSVSRLSSIHRHHKRIYITVQYSLFLTKFASFSFCCFVFERPVFFLPFV